VAHNDLGNTPSRGCPRSTIDRWSKFKSCRKSTILETQSGRNDISTYILDSL
jgi:hypothetical protein